MKNETKEAMNELRECFKKFGVTTMKALDRQRKCIDELKASPKKTAEKKEAMRLRYMSEHRYNYLVEVALKFEMIIAYLEFNKGENINKKELLSELGAVKL